MNPAILARTIPFAAYIAFLAVGPLLAGMLPSAIDSRWLYGVQITAAAAALAFFWSRFSELGPGSAPTREGWAWALGSGVAVFVLWINLDFPPLILGEAGGFDPTDAGRVHVPLALTRLAGAALIVPVMEELFWRSFIMRWLERSSFEEVAPSTVGWKALVISSAVFATEHHLWFAGLLAGLAYGWVYRRTGSLWVPVIAHAVTNGLLGVWVLYTGNWGFW